MGVDENHLIESLRNRVQNDATVAYYLLFDNRSHVSSGYLGAKFQESTEGHSTGLNSDNSLRLAAGPHFLQDSDLRTQLPSEKKWILGLQSPAHPREIMTQVLLTLQKMNVRWKKIGHYNMKCLWVHSFVSAENMNRNHADDDLYISNEFATISINAHAQRIVKFELQLFKTSEENYLLDLQRVHGPQMLFLELCAAFLMQLGVLN